MKQEKIWWNQGVQFECQGSGKCCVSHNGYGYVYFTKEDRRRMAAHLKIPTQIFTKQYCVKQGPVYHLKEVHKNGDCRFLKNKQCSAYEGRPTQCRTWPFWPEVMNAKSWQKDVVSFCPGIGKGRIWSKTEIDQNLEIQTKSEDSFETA